MNLWLKIKQEGLRGFWSMFPLTKVPFWYWFFEPQPLVKFGPWGHFHGKHCLSGPLGSVMLLDKKVTCCDRKGNQDKKVGSIQRGNQTKGDNTSLGQTNGDDALKNNHPTLRAAPMLNWAKRPSKGSGHALVSLRCPWKNPPKNKSPSQQRLIR